MKVESAHRAIAALLMLMALSGGCGIPEDNQQQPGPGWTQLPDSPLPPGRDGSVAFWAGDRLVVAGGTDLGEPLPGSAGEVQEIRPTGQTVSYLPSANKWVEESPLVVPGYDGVVDMAGVWMGTYWLGVGSACQTATGDTLGFLNQCAKNRIAVRWELSAGWTVLPSPPAEAFAGIYEGRDETSQLVPLGPSEDSALFASKTGVALLNREGAWSFTPWPFFDPTVTVVGASCLQGNEIFVATNDDPLVEAGGTTMETDTLLAVDVTSGVVRTVWSGQTGSYSPGAGLVCLPDAVLYQPAQTEAILAVSAIGVRELPLIALPATEQVPAQPLTLRNDMLVADGAVVEFGGGPDQVSWYLDATGTPLFFPSALAFSQRVWADGQIFVQLASDYDTPAAGQWFVLVFDPENPEPDLAEAVFPIPTDTAPRIGG